jgi:hypothetical protein
MGGIRSPCGRLDGRSRDENSLRGRAAGAPLKTQTERGLERRPILAYACVVPRHENGVMAPAMTLPTREVTRRPRTAAVAPGRSQIVSTVEAPLEPLRVGFPPCSEGVVSPLGTAPHDLAAQVHDRLAGLLSEPLDQIALVIHGQLVSQGSGVRLYDQDPAPEFTNASLLRILSPHRDAPGAPQDPQLSLPDPGLPDQLPDQVTDPLLSRVPARRARGRLGPGARSLWRPTPNRT